MLVIDSTMAEEIDEQAEELRLLGNEAFANKKWEESIDNYEESLSLDGDSKNSGIGYDSCFDKARSIYSYLLLTLCLSI